MTADVQPLHAQGGTIDPADIRWRVGQISKKDAHKGSLLGYIDARTCMEALDALDPNWSAVHGDPIVVGTELIGVPCRVTVNGVTRSDVGMPSSQEPIKGAYSDALKRAAVHFGIGRELYELPRIYVKLDDYKKPVAIPAYRNGRWTLPPGAGSVFYARDPEDQPERTVGGEKPSSPRRSAPAPHRDQYRKDELVALMREKSLKLDAVERYAAIVGIDADKGATHEQMDELIAALQGHGTAAVIETPAIGDARSSDPATTQAPEAEAAPPGTVSGAASASDSSGVRVPTPPDDTPPKPGTDRYKALEPLARARARQFWSDQAKAEPEQESLAEALGAPAS